MKTIGKHIGNAIKEKPAKEVVVAKFATAQNEKTRAEQISNHHI